VSRFQESSVSNAGVVACGDELARAVGFGLDLDLGVEGCTVGDCFPPPVRSAPLRPCAEV